MPHVSKNQQNQIQYLLEQSFQGNHILFDHDSLTHVLRHGADRGLFSPLSVEEACDVERHIEFLVATSSLARKRAYLESLDSRTYAWVVRTYFNIVEMNLWESQEVRH
jgi:hypothetical protein